MTAIIDTDCDVTDELPTLRAAGVTTIGRYLDRLTRRDDEWRIAHRHSVGWISPCPV